MEPLSRRGALTLGALSLLRWAGPAHAAPKARALLLINLQGGPSQLETWDPHPGVKNGGPTEAIPTKIPDLKIAHLYPQVAERIDALSVIRSLTSKEGDHERATYYLKTGHRLQPALSHPSAASILERLRPPHKLDIPANVSIGKAQWPAKGGYLGARFDAFQIRDPQQSTEALTPRVPDARQKKRLKHLDVIEAHFSKGREAQVKKTLHRETIDRAVRMMRSEQVRAFNLSEEPSAIQAAYGDNAFGQGCLLARRLLETGVKAVEVTLDGFDSHTDNFETHQAQASILDPALATLIKELQERELLRSTLLLCTGEFGRTPKINLLEGRDHWPKGFSALIGGAGLRAGQVIGNTGPDGTGLEDPVSIETLHATLFRALGIDGEGSLMAPSGRPIPIAEGKPLQQLF